MKAIMIKAEDFEISERSIEVQYCKKTNHILSPVIAGYHFP